MTEPKSSTEIPRLVSGRVVAARLKVPLADLLPALERAGVRVWRIRTGRSAPRVRLCEEDVLRFLRDASRGELPAGDRVQLAIDMALEESGLQRRRERPR